jgi:hypothetical protein
VKNVQRRIALVVAFVSLGRVDARHFSVECNEFFSAIRHRLFAPASCLFFIYIYTSSAASAALTVLYHLACITLPASFEIFQMIILLQFIVET